MIDYIHGSTWFPFHPSHVRSCLMLCHCQNPEAIYAPTFEWRAGAASSTASSSLPILGRRAKTKVVSFVVEKERKAEAYGRRLSLGGGTHQELQLRNVLMLYVLQFYAVAFTTFVIYCICISPFNMPSKFNIRRVGCSASVFCLALLGLLIILVACRYGMGWSLCVTKRQRLVSSLVSLEISSTLSLEGYQRD